MKEGGRREGLRERGTEGPIDEEELFEIDLIMRIGDEDAIIRDGEEISDLFAFIIKDELGIIWAVLKEKKELWKEFEKKMIIIISIHIHHWCHSHSLHLLHWCFQYLLFINIICYSPRCDYHPLTPPSPHLPFLFIVYCVNKKYFFII